MTEHKEKSKRMDLDNEGMDYIKSIMRSYKGSEKERLKKTVTFIDMALAMAEADYHNPFDPTAFDHYLFLYYVRNVLIRDIYNQLDNEDGPEFITTWN